MNVNANSYSMNAYAASATYTTGNFSMSASYFQVTGGTSSATKADATDFSGQALELAEKAKGLDIFKCIFPNNDIRKNAKTLDEVGSDFQNDFANFSSMFSQMSSMLGLDSGNMFTMGLNGTGGMNVTGSDESQASALQNAFNGSSGTTSTMTMRFAVMAARAALVDAGDTVDGFSSDYANDPFAAITKNIEALKERLLGFRVESNGNGGSNYGFVRSFSAQIEYSSYTTNATSAAAEETAEEAAAEEGEAAAEVA